MIAATLEEQKRAKIRFFAVYTASVILIVIIIFSLWRNDSSNSAVNASPAFLPTENEKVVQADVFLHNRLEALDNGYSAALAAGKTGMEAQRNNLQLAETTFKTALDSVEKEAGAIKDAQQKAALMGVVGSFRKSVQSRSSLMSGYTTLLADTSRSINVVQNQPGANNAEMQELKSILVEKEEKVAALEKQRVADLAEKDKIITSLQTQVAQKSNVSVQPISTTGDSEWKQKYTKLKASYDNIAGQNNSLNRSYKTIVDDNRRLLSQLQAARKQ